MSGSYNYLLFLSSPYDIKERYVIQIGMMFVCKISILKFSTVTRPSQGQTNFVSNISTFFFPKNKIFFRDCHIPALLPIYLCTNNHANPFAPFCRDKRRNKQTKSLSHLLINKLLLFTFKKFHSSSRRFHASALLLKNKYSQHYTVSACLPLAPWHKRA